jgi:hypothetical protein
MLYVFGGKTDLGKLLNDLVIIGTTKGEVRCLKLTGAPQPRAFYASVYLPATNEIAVIGVNTEKGLVATFASSRSAPRGVCGHRRQDGASLVLLGTVTHNIRR